MCEEGNRCISQKEDKKQERGTYQPCFILKQTRIFAHVKKEKKTENENHTQS